MSTIHDLNWVSDDEPDDADYALPNDEVSSESDSDERPSKKVKVSKESSESIITKEAVEDLWKSFNEDVPIEASKETRRKIKITKTIKFAGEVTTEEVEVWEDSEDGRAWSKLENVSQTTANVSTTSTATTINKPKPNKPRNSLAALSASLTKPTKLTTLEKSKLDWDRFVSDQKLEEDLIQSKKSRDNFLDREDFKRRTEEKRLENLDRLKR